MKQQNLDLPVEVAYKYLLRDYRELQKENNELKKRLKSLTAGIIDSDSEEFKKVIEERAQKYHKRVKDRLQQEIENLKKEIEVLKGSEHPDF